MIVDTEKIYNQLLAQVLCNNSINAKNDVSSSHEGIKRDTV